MGPEIRGKPRRSLTRPFEQSVEIPPLEHEFEFISVQNPEDARDREKRRQARSHAIRRSLRNKRLQKSESDEKFQLTAWPHSPSGSGKSLSIAGSQNSLPRLYAPSASVPDPFRTLSVDSVRLKQLLDRYASRQAIEPVFTIENGVTFQAFNSVFRTGLEDPALLSAIMLAFSFEASSGILNQECLHYRGQAIHFIRERMDAPTLTPTEPILGAILLIAGVEARLGMRSQVQIHMKGIKQLLQAAGLARVHLTDGIKRAIFWQDLNASLMTGSERVVDHTTFAELGWRRDPFTPLLFELPPGFQPMVPLFTDEFVEVVKDINALQCIRNSPSFVDDTVAMVHIDNQQAWIESRLWALPRGSAFQECCNYAAYLAANLLCCKVWRTSAIPPYLSSQILRILKQTTDASEWDEYPDFLLWLLYMGGSVARDGMVRSEYVALLQSNLSKRHGVRPIAWADLVEVMKQFIWSESVVGPTIKALWEESQAVSTP
ncbi:hypothetical protein BX600DRAFT_485035 [Xylariales sp. PMI_506]|nr:hypothetical protein BX600DRAFT_485035 [Xylariales sp. PMI_506]